ncbi:CCAAT displacement transcription factor COY1 NDAI_0A00830 [Naumovozyma dairenensis CBS 421]|uniref:Protein CASP n=1 Tax=Naumovozyma dairenensis (strain ATCC 10597 / BCRC 20456 / CBS 421 / NBRC 0211 / NRRL Y-12639) TaxID=1071378 RepID=G0W353_NAUDC|nr:hypothetical protein NDAI_0A00830 [Naumovozyma dairenensis CBS 421]CCD22241.1 hypothetical protein NDAI_0A00830 [Naumovozyma dairenensis CBS 421]
MDTSVYSHAFELWSEADLTKLQESLDSKVLEVKEKETSSLESRKFLATETKKFKKLQDDEKLAQLNKIIKHYQHEVDNLTQRSKFSEDIVIEVYSRLSEAPDPKPLLQNSIDKLSKIEDSKALKEKIAHLEDSLAKYADYDTMKSRLLDLEQNSAVTLSKRITAKEQELNSTWEEKERNWKDRENELNKQLNSLQMTNKVLSTKLANYGEEAVESTGDNQGNFNNTNNTTTPKSSTEFNLLVQELESAQSRIMQLEERNVTLNTKLTKATSEEEKEAHLHAKELKINQLESENVLLSASFERERSELSKIKDELQDQIKEVKNESISVKSELETVRRKLNNYSDYNKIKEELSALKKIEFGADDTDEDDDDVVIVNNVEGKKLDTSLLSANKKLQSNLAELRVENMNFKNMNKDLNSQLMKLKSRVQEVEAQNAKLELDLESVDDISQNFNDTASMISGVTRQMNNRTGKLSPTSSIVGIPEDREFSASTNNSTILPIITKQRDRFRTRNMDLEKQLRLGNNEKTKLLADINKLKSQNTKLYERIRYLSSFANTDNQGKALLDNSDMLDTEAQYSTVYEESLHPLANFKNKELEHYKKNKLSVLEKLFLSLARVILQNKTTRAAFLFYCLGLHGLVFMMSMYVINLSGYLTPEVGIVQSTTSSSSFGLKDFDNPLGSPPGAFDH